ncbi:MAG: hypothetical protein U1E17_04435 [Geminicoccaceae bacterium]
MAEVVQGLRQPLAQHLVVVDDQHDRHGSSRVKVVPITTVQDARGATMRLDDLAHDRQAQPSAFRRAGTKGSNRCAHRRRHTVTVISDREQGCSPASSAASTTRPPAGVLWSAFRIRLSSARPMRPPSRMARRPGARVRP